MTEFMWVSLFLSLLALGFVLLPIRFVVAKTQSTRRDESNVQAFKTRLQELEQESELGHYTSEEKQALKKELELRLLDEVDEAGELPANGIKLIPLILVVVLCLPLGSWLIYQQTGAKDDYDLYAQLGVFQQAATQAELEAAGEVLIASIKRKLARDSEERALWMMLGRAQTRLQRYAEAEQSFQQLMQLAGEDPVVMGLYVQARYMAAGRQMDEVAHSLAQRVLELQPNNGTVLGMLGMASFEQQDYRAAVSYWEQLLVLLDPASPTAKMIQQGIDKAKVAAGDSLVSDTNASKAALTVSVSLAEGLSPPEGAMVFIYARAANGPKMPLAVVRRQASELPLTVTLDETMAMSQAMSLLNFDQVELVARVSSSGIANASAGDLEGVVGPIATSDKALVDVVITRVLN